MAKKHHSPLWAVLTCAALGIGSFCALVTGLAYLHLIAPMSLANDIGAGWYLFLVSLAGGSAIGIVVGLVHGWLHRHATVLWAAGLVASVTVAYLGFWSWSVERPWSGKGWWVPLLDVGAFAAAFMVTVSVAAKRDVRAQAI